MLEKEELNHFLLIRHGLINVLYKVQGLSFTSYCKICWGYMYPQLNNTYPTSTGKGRKIGIGYMSTTASRTDKTQGCCQPCKWRERGTFKDFLWGRLVLCWWTAPPGGSAIDRSVIPDCRQQTSFERKLGSLRYADVSSRIKLTFRAPKISGMPSTAPDGFWA